MIEATQTTVILRSRALARRLEGWPHTPALIADPSRLAEAGEHLRMTAVLVCPKEVRPQREPSLRANGSAQSAAR
jgi:hypothetical protein